MNTKRKIVYGVAHNDYAGRIKENGKHIRSYRSWISMLSRCYGEKELNNRPSYKGCSVCDEWLLFSNFKKWFDDPTNGYQNGYCLDKDILIKGNKVYSPNTCCFVPNEIRAESQMVSKAFIRQSLIPLLLDIVMGKGNVFILVVLKP